MENTNLAKSEATDMESQTAPEAMNTVTVSIADILDDLDYVKELFPTTSSSNDFNNDSSDMLSDCETPKENMFNPFPIASDKIALAPMKKKKKASRKFKLPACHKLDFDNCLGPTGRILEFSTDDENEPSVESLCQSFLGLVMANRSINISDSNDEHLNEFTTPVGVPRNARISSYRCPDPPIKREPESWITRVEPDQSLCRKLDFESC